MDCRAVHPFAKRAEKKKINVFSSANIATESARLVLEIIKNTFQE